jgi:N-acetylglucosamine-6-sulfatase
MLDRALARPDEEGRLARRAENAPHKGRIVAVAVIVSLAMAAAGQILLSPAAPASASTARTSAAVQATVPAAVAGRRMNIVLVTTDDQRLDEMAWMPRTRRLIGDPGVTFDDAISPHPMCCPARAEILTGQLAQNNGVRHNTGPWGGFRAFVREHRRDHVGSWLSRAGYNTAFVGKFLNGYTDKAGDQPGWTEWNPTTAGTYRYTRFSMRIDGRRRHFDLRRNRAHYVADVVARRSEAFVRQFAKSRKPFFIWVSHVGPHDASRNGGWGPPIPAPRHSGLFATSRPGVLDQPNYRESDISDKPSPVRARQTGHGTSFFTRWHRARIRTLQAIDEANGSLVRALERAGELEDTMIVFTTDNGYLQGENGLIGKNWPYESALRVPMLVRGPGIPAGQQRHASVTTVDLTPTFLAAAGAPRASTDGANLFPALLEDVPTSNTALIQAGAATQYGWLWRGVRTTRYVYAEWTSGDRELYDLQVDPYQLENLVDPATGAARLAAYAPVLADMQRRYAALRRCAGAEECQADLGPLPEPVA